MIDLFSSVKGLIKVSEVRIDNNLFRLHYKLTVIVLVLFSLLVTSRQYIGDPIDCIVDEIPADIMDAYCWIYSTFTVPKSLSGRIGLDVIQPGVKQHIAGKDQVKYHKYYQWVCFVLFFQAVLFYIPHYFWKTWEGGRLSKIVQPLKKPIIQVNEEVKSQIKVIVEYFDANLHCHSWYAYRYFFAETFNLINVIGQIFFLDYFLDGEFSTYGWKVFMFTNQDPEDRVDPMAEVFPKITKCTFQKYGPSGTVQRFDGLCVLPVNIINEKIYVFLWFWLVILAAVTCIGMIYRIATIFIRPLRERDLLQITVFTENDCKLDRDTNVIKKDTIKDAIKAIAKDYYVGDWFMLSQIGANIDPFVYKQLIESLHYKNSKKA